MLDEKDFEDLNLEQNEAAIAKAINWLQFNDPANANREYAIGLLKRMHEVAKGIADKSQFNFEEFIDQTNKSLKN